MIGTFESILLGAFTVLLVLIIVRMISAESEGRGRGPAASNRRPPR